MKAKIELADKTVEIDFSKPIDISMPLGPDPNSTSAWYVEPVSIEPVRADGFIGDVNQGGSVNFNNIKFNPHGNGTHTECVGHISSGHESINQHLKRFLFTAKLISVEPETQQSDKVISLAQIKSLVTESVEAIVIRTLPNTDEKLTRQYSQSNPPYIEKQAIIYLNSLKVDHILIDLPSVDREEDDGVLSAHHEFWNYPNDPQLHKTITEFIYVPSEINDGFYILNLQIAPFENDASPSKPVLYKIL